MTTKITSQQVIDTLTAMRVHVAQGWTRGANYRDAEGCSATVGEARSFCLHGALCCETVGSKNNNVPLHNEVEHQLNAAVKRTGFEHQRPSYVNYNDSEGRKVEDILALIDDTITHVTKE